MARARKTSTNGNGYQPRLKERYEQELRPQLKDQLGVSSVMDVPRLQKITLNMGIGDAKTEAKVLENALDQLTTIAGQRAQVRLARKSIASLRSRRVVESNKSLVVKASRPQKFKVRNYTRCRRCGRPRAVYRKFGLCRICLRELAHEGAIPGMTKSSW